MTYPSWLEEIGVNIGRLGRFTKRNRQRWSLRQLKRKNKYVYLVRFLHDSLYIIFECDVRVHLNHEKYVVSELHATAINHIEGFGLKEQRAKKTDLKERR